jgi:hypothetical protein
MEFEVEFCCIGKEIEFNDKTKTTKLLLNEDKKKPEAFFVGFN